MLSENLVEEGLLPSLLVKSKEQVKTIVDDFVEVFNQIRNQ